MFLSEPSETQFDLRFWLFGVHVRVHPFFWILTLMLGWSLVREAADQRTGLIHLGLWVICVFVSILIHEMGHVFMGRQFGSHGHIVLYSFGGLAIGSNALDRGWQRFLVLFAGPLIQFVLLGGTILAAALLFAKVPEGWQIEPSLSLEYVLQLDPEPVGWRGPALIMLGFLFEINLLWPILNLLPVWPLDGGQMAREVLAGVTPRNGNLISFAVSICVAGAFAIYCLITADMAPDDRLFTYLPKGSIYLAMMFGYLCFGSIRGFQAENARRQSYRDDKFPWHR